MTDQSSDISSVSLGDPADPDNLIAPDEDLHQEIHQDAIAELDRLSQANLAGLKAGSGSDSHIMSSYGLSMDQASVYERPDEGIGVPRERGVEPRILEDLYGLYPEIGQGLYYLRVERQKPTHWRGELTKGWIDDVHDQLSLSDMQSRYGGGLYHVHVIGPGRSGGGIRSLRTLRVEIPGAPLVGAGQQPQGDNMSNTRSDPHMANVEITKLKLAADERRRAEDREERIRRTIGGARGFDTDVLSAVEQLARERSTEVKGIQDQLLADYRASIQQSEKKVQRLEDLLAQLREALVQERTVNANKLREEETRQIREIKERNDYEVSRLKEDHSKEYQRIIADYQRQITEINERGRSDREQLAQREQLERDRMRQEYLQRENQAQEMVRRREEDLIRSNMQQMESMRITYEGRLNEQERSMGRELRSSESNRDLMITSIRQTEEMRTVSAKETAAQQIQLLQAENTRAMVELEAARTRHDEVERRYEDLRMGMMKDPITAVSEAQDLLGKLGVGKESEDGDMRKQIFQIAQQAFRPGGAIEKGIDAFKERNLMATAHQRLMTEQSQRRVGVQRQQMGAVPQMARRLPTQRQQSQQPPSPPPQMQIQRPQQPQQPQQPAPLEASQREVKRPPRMPDWHPTTPLGGGHLPAQSQSRSSAEELFDSAVSSAASPGIRTPSGPVSHEDQSSLPGSSFQLSPEADLLTAQSEERLPFTEEQAENLVKDLNIAVSSGMMSPAAFADEMINKMGRDVAGVIANGMEPDSLIQAVAGTKEGRTMTLVTKEGRDFVRSLWAELRSRCG